MKNSEIKEVLIDIRDNRLGKESVFVCHCFKASEMDAHDFFVYNTPSQGKFEEFTKSKYWVWWHIADLNSEERKGVLEEKKRFLTALIETL